jgi:hypothetical protein
MEGTAMAKKRRLRPVFAVTLDVIIATVMACGMLYIFAQAVLQESYRNYPPTQEEVANDPNLKIYMEENK